MSPEIQAFAAGFPTTLAHAGLSLALLLVGGVLYAWLSPRDEVGEIREGNPAAAVAFGGVLFGLALPLAVSLAASATLLEILIWGGAVTAVQLLLFRIADFILRGLPGRISQGDVAAAVLLVAAKLATSVLLAAGIAG
jgi:putative membrane protein